MRAYYGPKLTNDPAAEGRLALMRLSEESGKDTRESLALVDRIATGELTYEEALALVRRLLLYEAAVLAARSRVALLAEHEPCLARWDPREQGWIIESDEEAEAFLAWMLRAA